MPAEIGPGSLLYWNSVAGLRQTVQGQAGSLATQLYVWQPSSLSFIPLTADVSGNLNTNGGGGGGGGGGAVTVADGADVAQGTTTDSAVVTDTSGTLSAKLRGLVKILASVWDSGNGRLKVDGSAVTQPISVVALPLPSGAARASDITSVITALGSPFQAGGSIANTSFAISGTLPAFAATPTFNLGTIGLAATAAKQDTLLAALGSPFQAGGSIANTSFGISGTLPAFAATPTFNLGTLNGAATTALQTTANTSLATIATALTTGPVPVSGTFWQSTQPVSIAATVTVSGPLTDTQLRATAVPVSIASMPSTPVTGTFWQTTQPISAVALPLPTGAALEGGNLATIAAAGATAANQASEIITLVAIANSLVTVATDVAPLVTVQGQTSAGVAGPLVQGVVSDTPNAATDGTIAPLSLTSEGRLRVAVEQAHIDFFLPACQPQPSFGAAPEYF